jgi:hypothetical protein
MFGQIKVKHEDGKWLHYANDKDHAEDVIESKPKRGIDNLYMTDILEGFKAGKRPKQLESDLRRKYHHQIDSAEYLKIPDAKSIANLKWNLSQISTERMGMKFLSDITDFIEKYFVKTKEEFLMKGM